MIRAYAKILVPVPGVPQRVTLNEANPAATQGCHGVLIQVLPTNLGKIYVGTATMNKTAFTELFAFLAIPTSNFIPSFSAALTLSPGGIQLRDLYIDADLANEGVIVTALIT
jgi:hypothetical protein